MAQSPFLRLPSEIRIRVYDYSCEWPDMRARFKIIEEGRKIPANEEKNFDNDADRKFEENLAQKFVTPNILLLNRQITAEALDVIRKKRLVVELPVPQRSPWSDPPDISRFIPRAALDAATLVTLRVGMNADNGKEKLYVYSWAITLNELVNIWVEQPNDLKSLHVQASGNRTVMSDEMLVYMLGHGTNPTRYTSSFMRTVTFGEGILVSDMLQGDKIAPHMYQTVAHDLARRQELKGINPPLKFFERN